MTVIEKELNINFKHGIAVMGSNLASLYSFDIPTFVFESGERSKNFQTLENLLNFMADNELCRDDYLYAIGGGVTGDLGGLAASIYARGINLVQIPTTLTAMVDSSIGGKTAVNLAKGKNLAGSFKMPEDVYIATSFLNSLPQRELNEGMAEVIKYSFIMGEDLLQLPIDEMIARCVHFKEKIVEIDPYDRAQRKVLNFGHTIGHAVEKASNYELLHGEAVAIGMVYITKIFKPELLPMLESMLAKFSLPISYDGEFDISLDKKRQGELIDVVIPYGFGDVRVEKINFEEFKKLCRLT